VNALDRMAGGPDDNAAQAGHLVAETRIPSGFKGMIGDDASTQEAHARTVLRELRRTLGEEAFAEWRLGVPDPLHAPEVLRSRLYGDGLPSEAENANAELGDRALSRAEREAAWSLRAVREAERLGRSPSQRRLAGQLSGELGAALSLLPPLGAPRASVRRLTPRETERLQGFPDDWTLIQWKGKPAPDSRRYAACGDAVTVPVAQWLGSRLMGAVLREAA